MKGVIGILVLSTLALCVSSISFRASSDDMVYPDVDDLELDEFDLPATGATGAATGMDEPTGGYYDEDDISLEDEIEEEEEETEEKKEDKPCECKADPCGCQQGPITVHVRATANGGNADSHAAVVIGGDDSVHKSYGDFMSTLGLGDVGEDEDENMLVRTGGVAI
jgi:hypothetical protein